MASVLKSAYESAQIRYESIQKRLWIGIVISVFLLLISNFVWAFAFQSMRIDNIIHSATYSQDRQSNKAKKERKIIIHNTIFET